MAHPLIGEAAALGVRLEADAGALLVRPASKLPADLRARIVAAKPVLLAELAANDDGDETDRDPARWLRFRALCTGRGVRPEELARHFPTVADREDIALTPDDALEALAVHMARVILAEREATAGQAFWDAVDGVRPEVDADRPDAWRTRAVTCGICRHLERTAGHPHAGRCRAHSPELTSAVVWDTDARTCSVFEETA